MDIMSVVCTPQSQYPLIALPQVYHLFALEYGTHAVAPLPLINLGFNPFTPAPLQEKKTCGLRDFSIRSILSQDFCRDGQGARMESGYQASLDNPWRRQKASPQEDPRGDNKYSWIHCTRFQPPRIPSRNTVHSHLTHSLYCKTLFWHVLKHLCTELHFSVKLSCI